MNLMTPAEIRAKAMRLWTSGQFLRAWLTGERLFPIDFPLKTPSGIELVNRFTEVSVWIKRLHADSKAEGGAGYQVVERVITHRQLGAQRLPERVLIEGVDDFLAITQKRQAFQLFQRLTRMTRERLPALEPFLHKKPLIALELAGVWEQLLMVCGFFLRTPRPQRYLRELDIEGVDTKFIEQHKAILRELLALVLPDSVVDATVIGLAGHGFERWLGLRYDPPLIRFRWLDRTLAPAGLTDLSLPLQDFAAYQPAVARVFITENKINGLSFPAQPGSMVIFGLGYGVQALAEVPWLSDRPIIYWGDIDTHGFAILARMRACFPQTRALLMDRETLLAHRSLWVQEPVERQVIDLARLSASEQSLLNDLQNNTFGERVRLEQERIPYAWLCQALNDR